MSARPTASQPDSPYLTRRGVQLPWPWILSTIGSVLVAAGLSWNILKTPTPAAPAEASPAALRDKVREDSDRIRSIETNIQQLQTSVAVIQSQNELARSDRAEVVGKLNQLLQTVYQMQGERQGK